ncbi:AAA-ATPase At3g28610-like [Nicotiana tabacum]|uniref:AAA-ATPase At3g28610-like n=1 Tax=Nicotiana tabacum TaxID=4097 RepID=A0AC58T3M4_TOBAC
MGIIGIRNYYGMWRHINFEHPATFDTLAMDPEKEEEIIDDLSSLLLARERTIIPRFEAFKVLAKNYLRIEHLLEEVDVSPCDVAENLMPKKSSAMPEICLENLIQVLKNAKKKASLNSQKNKNFSTILVKTCARLRRFEAFKVLAKNYLRIEHLLEEVDVSPCDVAENLMPKNSSAMSEICLENLIQVLKNAKKKASLNSQKNKNFSTILVKTCGRLISVFEGCFHV